MTDQKKRYRVSSRDGLGDVQAFETDDIARAETIRVQMTKAGGRVELEDRRMAEIDGESDLPDIF